MNTIEVRNLNKSFGTTRALVNVSFTLEPNKIYGLLGRNGAGKTTLLNIIVNKLYATNGEVLVDGEAATENPAAQAKIFYMSAINLYPMSMRVRDAINWTKEFYPLFDLTLANALALKFGLDTKKKIKEMSTGYNSILKIVLALSSGAAILIFDEPVLGLDANYRDLFYKELITRYSDNPCTVIISTHLIEEVAEVLEEVIIIKNGSVIQHQSVESLLKSAYTVSGEVSAVDSFTGGKTVIHTQTMGRFKSATVHEVLDDSVRTHARELNLDVTAAELQKLFIDLTNS